MPKIFRCAVEVRTPLVAVESGAEAMNKKLPSIGVKEPAVLLRVIRAVMDPSPLTISFAT